MLRQYALHTLFIPPAPSPGSEPVAPPRNPFPFTQKPNTLDRDYIVVPIGWDSWGKITLLRDGFDAKAWGEAWERALEAAAGEPVTESTATRMYAQLVPDQGHKVSLLSEVDCRLSLTTIITASNSAATQRARSRTKLPREELRRDCKARRQRPARYIPKPNRDASRGCRGSFGQHIAGITHG